MIQEKKINLLFTLCLALILTGVFGWLTPIQNQVTFSVDLEPSKPATSQVSWSSRGSYSEEDSRFFEMTAKRKVYSVDIPGTFLNLRFAPSREYGHFQIHRISLALPLLGGLCHWNVQTWDTPAKFKLWEAGKAIGDLRLSSEGVSGDTQGKESYLTYGQVLAIPQGLLLFHWIDSFVLSLISLFLCWLVLGRQRGRIQTVSTSPGSPPDFSALTLSGLGLFALVFIFLYWYSPVKAPLNPPPSRLVGQMNLVDRDGHSLSGATGGTSVVLDPFSLYRFAPNIDRSDFHTDIHGYRGGIPDNQLPIAVVLGGSAAAGWLLNSDSETFTAQLNKINHTYRFVNSAVVSFGSGQELGEMVHRADDLEPKLYIVMDGWNEYFIGSHYRKGMLVGYHKEILDDIEDKLLERAQLKYLSTDRASPPSQNVDIQELDDVIYSTYSRNIEKMSAFANARGAKILFLFQPEIGSKFPRTSEEEAHMKQWRALFRKQPQGYTYENFTPRYQKLGRRIQEFCRKKKIPFLNLNADPRISASSEALFEDLVHPTSLGHQKIAEIINEMIGEKY